MSTRETGSHSTGDNDDRGKNPKHAVGTPDTTNTASVNDGEPTQVHNRVDPSSTNDGEPTQVHNRVEDQHTEALPASDSSQTREHPTQHAGAAAGTGAAASAAPATRAQPATTQPVSHTKNPDDARHHTDDDSRSDLPAKAEREALLAREKETFGGMKFGSAFFGWLTATGMAVLLTALVAAAGAVFGLSTNTNLTDAADQAAADPQTVGITSAIILLVILLASYFAGGYVAGRMARFNGAKQGVAVWLWALIIAVLVAILGLVFGSQFDILANLNSFPRLPLNEGNLTTAGIIAVVVAALAALVGAVLGGMTGMRYHRRIDRADYSDTTNR